MAPDFPERAPARLSPPTGGSTDFIRLTLPVVEQERRIDAADRGSFGKLRSLDLLRLLRVQFTAGEAAMPPPALTIDTGQVTPEAAARMIAAALGLPLTPPRSP